MEGRRREGVEEERKKVKILLPLSYCSEWGSYKREGREEGRGRWREEDEGRKIKERRKDGRECGLYERGGERFPSDEQGWRMEERVGGEGRGGGMVRKKSGLNGMSGWMEKEGVEGW